MMQMVHKVFVSVALVLAFTSAVLESTAQIYAVIDGGTATKYTGAVTTINPLTDWYWTCRHTYLIRASEILASGGSPGMLESIALRVIVNNSVFPSRYMRVSIAMTNLTAMPTTYSLTNTNFTQTWYNGAWNVPIIANNPSGTWYEFKFSTPIQWNGTDNVLVQFCSYRTAYTNNGPTIQYYQPGFNAFAYRWTDGADYCNVDYNSTSQNYRPTFRLGILAGIESSFPSDLDPNRILRASEVYDGTNGKQRPHVAFRQTNGQTIRLKYRIVGPLPSTNVIYEARQGGNPQITHVATSTSLFTYNFTEAVGPAAGAGGVLDLTSIGGGAYRLEAEYAITGYTQTWQKEFIVAFDNDVAAAQIRSPLSVPRKYPRGVATPVSMQIQNVGFYDVEQVRCIAEIKRQSTGQVVYRDTVEYDGSLPTGNRATLDFSSFNSLEVGNYTLSVCAELLNAIDMQSSNDCLPPSGGSHVFQLLYNQEAGALSIGTPNNIETYYANRPFTPIGNIENGGILDLSNIPTRMQIYRLPARTLVYNELVIVPDCGAEPPNNIASAQFPPFIPDAAGQYEACLTVEMNDQIPDNDRTCFQFTVEGNLNGTYTIGTTKSGQSRNYLTIQDAVNDLYKKGIDGAVTFELTDAAYSVGSTSITNAPALDLSTMIIGASAANTITFVPSLERSLSKGSVVITLNSGNGTGILFGQSITATNPEAVQIDYGKQPFWNNSNGNIRFDGGSQKSIVLQLNASTPFRAPVYLGDGSRDIHIKNCVIRNAPGATPSYATSLPTIFYGFNLFQFQPDVRVVGGSTQTYSAGIIHRSKLPVGLSGNNSERLDTIPGSGNQFIGNEVYGFGYGIVSMGIGLALKGGINEFREYYNTGTRIEKNDLHDLRGAGIFCGYEQGARIRQNMIYNIGATPTNGTNVDAAGIRCGGIDRYHNIDLDVQLNDISGITGDVMTRGIVVEQVQNVFPSLGQGSTNSIFPDGPEHTRVANNVIWGLKRTNASANMAGIHLYTQRDPALSGVTRMLTPNTDNYFTSKDSIVFNTVRMVNDNVTGTGAVAGIGVQHGGGTVVRNNVVIMEGASTASNLMHAALFLQGVQLTDGNDPLALDSDRNAYQLGNAGMAHFVEITATSEIVSSGSMTEYQTIDQWRAWTRRDRNSVTGNLVNDHVLNGIAPKQQLRIKTNPTPIGSVLNDRGQSLAGIGESMTGNRSMAGQLPDIGACEFDGRSYTKDLETVSILKPTAYKASTGTLSDAEYVMVVPPAMFEARIRNTGSLVQTQTSVRIRVFIETVASNNGNFATPQWSAASVVDKTLFVDLNAGEEVDLDMAVSNFYPQPYQQLVGYTVPAQFSGMARNVTPRYLVEVAVGFDENNGNNTKQKVVRYFVRRADTRILASVASANATLSGTSPVNTIAGRLNGDSLIVALNRLGFVNNPSTGQNAYDVLDRTNWEERSIDYTQYRTLFWSGDQTRLSRFQRRDLRMFVDAGTIQEKKNLCVASQEYPRQHVGSDVTNDEKFINEVLRVRNVAPGTPVPTSQSYHNKKVRGDAIARNSVETVQRTSFAGDVAPNPALVATYSSQGTSGVAFPSYIYVKGDRETANDSIMGCAAASLTKNTVYLGVDWRHWQSNTSITGVERVVRGVIDFFETYGGTVVPVELVSFDARARGNNVDVMWSTASEMNSDHFVVERAEGTAGENQHFFSRGSVTAAGTSTERKDYLFRDENLSPGTYAYRLVSVDKDGSSESSEAVNVVVKSGDLAISSIAPQPATGDAVIAVFSPVAAVATVSVTNAAGAVVLSTPNVSLPVGATTIPIDTSVLAAGSYTVVVSTPEGSAVTSMVVVK